MLRTKGYMMKKVWENGRLREDIEMSEEGNDQGIKLVIRDKDIVEDIAIPREAILRAMFSEKPSSRPLTERLVELVETSPTRLSSKTKSKPKSKPKSKTKGKTKTKARKAPKRKTAKKRSEKARRLVCRME